MSKKYPCTKGDFKQAEEYTTRTNCLEAEARKFKLENKHTFLTERVSRNILQRKMLDFHDIQIFKSGLGWKKSFTETKGLTAMYCLILNGPWYSGD